MPRSEVPSSSISPPCARISSRQIARPEAVAVRLRRAGERLEQPAAHLLGDARPGVGHVDREKRRRELGGDPQPAAALAHGLDRVLRQVEQDAEQLVGVGLDHEVGRDRQPPGDAPRSPCPASPAPLPPARPAGPGAAAARAARSARSSSVSPHSRTARSRVSTRRGATRRTRGIGARPRAGRRSGPRWPGCCAGRGRSGSCPPPVPRAGLLGQGTAQARAHGRELAPRPRRSRRRVARARWSTVPSSGRLRKAAISPVIRRSGRTIIRCRPKNSMAATRSDRISDRVRMRIE